MIHRHRNAISEYIELFKGKDIGCYQLSQARPGVDSIIEIKIIGQPNFEQAEDLMQKIEGRTIEFAYNIISIINESE